MTKARLTVSIGALSCVCLLLVPGLLHAQRVSAAQAEARIKKHIGTIEEREQRMSALYSSPDAATATLKREIDRTHSKGDLVVASFLRWDWDAVDKYYSYHKELLSQSLDFIRAQGSASAEDLEYLDRGMAKWAAHEREIPPAFEKYVHFLATHESDYLLNNWSYNDKYQTQVTGLRYRMFEALSASRTETQVVATSGTPSPKPSKKRKQSGEASLIEDSEVP